MKRAHVCVTVPGLMILLLLAAMGASQEATGKLAQIDGEGDADAREYLKYVRARIWRIWRQHSRPAITAAPNIQFVIAADGSVGDIAVVESSGNAALDQRAMDAISSSAPFAPLPRSMAPQFSIRSTFRPSERISPHAFDAQHADFKAWLDHFAIEAWKNWVIPGLAGPETNARAALEFVVERDGSVSKVTILQSSGIERFDLAAQKALVGARLLPLPTSYAPPRVSMGVTFAADDERGPSR